MSINRQNTLSLEEQYDAIIDDIVSYYAFSDRIISRRKLLHYVFLPVSKAKLQMVIRQMALVASTSVKHDFEYRKEIFRRSKMEERRSPYFRVLVSKYPLEALAERLEQLFPKADFNTICRLYEARAPHAPQLKDLLERWGRPGIAWVIYGVGTLILRTVPEAFLKRFGVEVDTFNIVVFIATLVLVVSVGGIAVVFSVQLDKYKKNIGRVQDYIQRVLNYLAIRAARNTDQC